MLACCHIELSEINNSFGGDASALDLFLLCFWLKIACYSYITHDIELAIFTFYLTEATQHRIHLHFVST